jgi:signal transduction histidine kinase
VHFVVSHQKYSELAELAGSFIHEIKNHLSTLGLNLQLLVEDFQEPQNPRERRALERIQRLQGECQSVIDVSNDFLRFARVIDLEFVTVHLGTVIEEMIDFFAPTARQGNVEIQRYIPADLPAVRIDRELFKQALLNLMLNALQAMPEGGSLIFQATTETTPNAPGSAVICLSVIDTGKGMRPEMLSRVFRPFFSTKPGGTGLGLPTTRKIIEAHGGSIEVQSESDRGTKFSIRLPAACQAESTTGPSDRTQKEA